MIVSKPQEPSGTCNAGVESDSTHARIRRTVQYLGEIQYDKLSLAAENEYLREELDRAQKNLNTEYLEKVALSNNLLRLQDAIEPFANVGEEIEKGKWKPKILRFANWQIQFRRAAGARDSVINSKRV